MVIYLYEATVYDEDSKSRVSHQGMTIADDYNDALHNIQDYYVGRTEHLVDIYLEEENSCECNCLELNDYLWNFVSKHGDLPCGWNEKENT